MPNPIAPRLNGDDYQARHFWLHGLDLLDPHSGVQSVGYEWKEAKSFDDVSVFYDPPRGQAHALPMSRHFKQIKWQTIRANRFGYADLADPSFIGATAVSLLARLRDAREPDTPVTRFSLVTTARITDNDPLAELVSGEDGVLRLDKLRVGKGPTSKMGQVRKCWRAALSLSSDDELFAILDNFAILDGQPDMEAMRDAVTTKAKSVGIHIPLSAASASDFRFDSLARQLIKRDIQILDRESLLRFLAEEGIEVAPTLSSTSSVVHVAIQSFNRLATDLSDIESGNILSLLDLFDGRYLRQGEDWRAISERIGAFLAEKARSAQAMRLILDAHASFAFVAGRVLHLKSGVRLELVQNGRKGPEIWHGEDGSHINAPKFEIRNKVVGRGSHLAVAISVARPTAESVRTYLASAALPAGRLLFCELPDGPDQAGVRGGQHAALLSDQVAAAIRDVRSEADIETVELFVAGPNALAFYLGQQAQAIGPHQMYEFDFDGAKGGSYFPSV